LECCKPGTRIIFSGSLPVYLTGRLPLYSTAGEKKLKFSHLVSQIPAFNRFIVEHIRENGAFYGKPEEVSS